jgi:hypothetical protein
MTHRGTKVLVLVHLRLFPSPPTFWLHPRPHTLPAARHASRLVKNTATSMVRGHGSLQESGGGFMGFAINGDRDLASRATIVYSRQLTRTADAGGRGRGRGRGLQPQLDAWEGCAARDVTAAHRPTVAMRSPLPAVGTTGRTARTTMPRPSALQTAPTSSCPSSTPVAMCSAPARPHSLLCWRFARSRAPSSLPRLPGSCFCRASTAARIETAFQFNI